MGDPAFVAPLRDELAKWLAAIENVDAQIGELQHRRGELAAKAEAARLLLGGGTLRSLSLAEAGRLVRAAEGSKAPPAGDTPAPVPLTAAITRVMADGRIRTPAEIRRDVAATGRTDATLTTRNGHFYSLLREMVDTGTLLKDGDRYRGAAAAKASARPTDGAATSDVTARIMGDPPPGRSALEQARASGC